MKRFSILCVTLTAFVAVGGPLVAQSATSQKVITITAEIESGKKKRIAVCCTPSEHLGLNLGCAYELEGDEGADAHVISVKNLCQRLAQEAVATSPSGEWYLFRKSQPRPVLYRVDCRSSEAWKQGPPVSSPPSSPAAAAPVVAAKDPAPGPPAQQPAPEKADEKAAPKRLLKKLEEDLAQQKKAVEELEKKLDKKIDELKKEVLEKTRALEEAQKNSCFRFDDQYQGKDEVTVAVAGSVLRFLKVKPREPTVMIGLSEAKAGEFLAEAQARETRPIFPHIYLAVPEKKAEVEPFFLQDRLIDPQLYSRLSGGKDAGRVSHQDAIRFIAALNTRCKGQVRFTLPSEEQLVAAAQRIYDPVADGFKPCETLRKEDLRSDITELFGHAWQLTNSPCKPFGNKPKESCPDDSFVRKGGAASSTNFLECLPEYRSPAPDDVAQQETSFRLALEM